MDDKIHNNWNDVPKDIKDTFDKIGLPEAEKNTYQEFMLNMRVKVYIVIC